MVTSASGSRCSRRRVLLAAAAGCLPFPALATGIYTRHELGQQYERAVTPRLLVPPHEVRTYGRMLDARLFELGRELLAPQYLLVIDSNPQVQAAFLFWRLVAGCYELVGASPASTAADGADAIETPQGLFEQAAGSEAGSGCETRSRQSCGGDRLRVYDFGWQRAPGRASGGAPALGRLLVRGAERQAEGRLGRPCADGCILLPASLIAFLDEYGVLDGSMGGDVTQHRQRHLLPFRGRHLLVIDSERDERPEWSPAPAS